MYSVKFDQNQSDPYHCVDDVSVFRLGSNCLTDLSWYHADMIWIYASFTLALTPVEGGLSVAPLPPGAEVFARSSECDVSVKDDVVKGDAGCPVTIAVVLEDGAVQRTIATIPNRADAEDVPDYAPPASPSASTEPKAPAVANVAAPAPAAVSSWTGGAYAVIGRDIGGFGFTTAGFGVHAAWTDSLQLMGQLEWGNGRSGTPHLEREEAVVQTLFLGSFGARYLYDLSDTSSVYIGALFGAGQMSASSVQDDRQMISKSTQPLMFVRPHAGITWRSGPVSLGIGWQVTLADGNYFKPDEYGTTDGDVPPENSGLLTQGLELNVGVQF